MGLPSTLGGIVGFLISVIFIIGISASDVFPDQSKAIKTSQEDFQYTLNRSISPTNSSTSVGFWGKLLGAVGVDGIYEFIRNFFSIAIAFVVMSVQYVFFYLGIIQVLPSEFYILFALLSSAFIIAVVKLVFLSGD